MAIEVIPAELVAAAGPVKDTGGALRELEDARRQVIGLVDTVPSEELRSALQEYVASWSHVALDLGDQANELGAAVQHAARWYAARERALARGFAVTGRVP